MLNTTLCYLERGDAYLMLHRIKKKDDLNRDKWIGIGGKCEEGESPEDCLLRECREETGLSLEEYRYRGLVTFVSDQAPTEYMHLFTAARWSGRQKECPEGDLAWIKKQELLSLPIWEGPADISVAELPAFGGGSPLFLPETPIPGGTSGAGSSGWKTTCMTGGGSAVKEETYGRKDSAVWI